MPGADQEYGTDMTLSLATIVPVLYVVIIFPYLEGRLVDAVHAKLLPSVHAEVPGNFFMKHAVFNYVLEVFSSQITNMDERLP